MMASGKNEPKRFRDPKVSADFLNSVTNEKIALVTRRSIFSSIPLSTIHEVNETEESLASDSQTTNPLN